MSKEENMALVRLAMNTETGDWFPGFLIGWLSEANHDDMAKAARYWLGESDQVVEGKEILREFDEVMAVETEHPDGTPIEDEIRDEHG